MENFKFWEAGVGLKMFRPKYQNAHLYAKSGRINRLAYVAVAVLCYKAPRKTRTREPIGKSSQSVTLRCYRAAVIKRITDKLYRESD